MAVGRYIMFGYLGEADSLSSREGPDTQQV